MIFLSFYYKNQPECGLDFLCQYLCVAVKLVDKYDTNCHGLGSSLVTLAYLCLFNYLVASIVIRINLFEGDDFIIIRTRLSTKDEIRITISCLV